MTVFNKNFVFMDAPGGETEDVLSIKAAGYAGVFCNVHAYEPTEWTKLRNLCKAVGLFCGPWARTNGGGGDFKPDILKRLIDTADAWNAPLIVNSESELVDTGSSVTSQIAQAVGSRDAAISTEAWLYNPPSVDWSKIVHLPFLLQIFPTDAIYLRDDPGDPMKGAFECQEHAWELGVKCVYFTFGTYKGMNPSMFILKAPFSLFTGNQVGARQEWNIWMPTSTGFTACKEVKPPVSTPWYQKPYPKGKAVGPATLPRVLKPPSKNGGIVMTGSDVDAIKRIVSKAQRWLPWEPSAWDNRYNELIAMGKGEGQVGSSGVRGFQRQEGITQTGVVDDATYQRMRRSLIPTGPNKGRPILDAVATKQIATAAYELSDNAKYDKIRTAITDFCTKAEANEALWHYTQNRPFTGLGADPAHTHFNDCSGYVILAYYWARQTTGLSVPDPSGYRYSGYGNTWDDLDGHERITSGNYLVGDLAHYDGHVTICKKSGDATQSRWSSMGTESGPEETTLYYRPDFVKVVRPPLLV